MQWMFLIYLKISITSSSKLFTRYRVFLKIMSVPLRYSDFLICSIQGFLNVGIGSVEGVTFLDMRPAIVRPI